MDRSWLWHSQGYRNGISAIFGYARMDLAQSRVENIHGSVAQSLSCRLATVGNTNALGSISGADGVSGSLYDRSF